MTYDAALRAYCRSVEGALRLKKQQKQEILKGLRQELEERFSSAETLTLEEINAEIGAYDKVANELMESVPLKERERYLTRRKWGSRIAIITFALLFVASVAFLSTRQSHGLSGQKYKSHIYQTIMFLMV